MTFLLGRLFFYEPIHSRLGKAEIFTLAQESSTNHPLAVALMLRFAPFPEIMKLLILSLLKDGISSPIALSAIILHSLPFTLLWTLVGNEATTLMNNPDRIPSRILQACTVASVIFGLFVSPALFGLWVHSLRKTQQKEIVKEKTQ